MLKGKTVLITGASRGIGRSVAVLFAKNGADLFLNARNSDVLDKTCSEIQSSNEVNVTPLPFDVSSPEEVKKGFRQIFSTAKKLDVLVNNAGILRDALIGMVTPRMIHEVFGANVFGTIYCCQYASRLMTRRLSSDW